jgi:hypothetical protein
LHDGYFNRFEDIGLDDQQNRVNAIGILKDVVCFILFRVSAGRKLTHPAG